MIEATVKKALDMLGLTKIATTPTLSLVGGKKKRKRRKRGKR